MTRPILIIAFVFVCAAVGGALASRYLIHSGAASLRATTQTRVQAQLLTLINERRARDGLRPLVLDMRLESAAAMHTINMIRGDYFSHDEPRGLSFARRASLLRRRVVRENIAWGTGSFGTARGTLTLWLASPEHRHTLLNPAMRRIGIAVLRGGPYAGQPAAIITTADLST